MVALAWGLLSGCTGPLGRDTDTEAVADADGDGFNAPIDCNDENPAVNPDAVEACNAVDDNCDGEVDEGEVYADLDGDGYGDATAPVSTLCVGEGSSATVGDCDDTDPSIHPLALEACDGIDADCDGARSTCWLEDVAEWTFMEFDPDHSDGSVVSLAGDVDGDGLADVLVGGGWGGYDWTTDEPEGQVHLFRGGELGLAGPYLLAEADWTLVGAEGSMAAGGHYTQNGGGAAYLPDFDGDGLSEVIVGAPRPYGVRGSAWLVTGATLEEHTGESSLPEVADQELFLDDPAEMYLGKTVGLAGDLDGDGSNEIAIGADGHLWLAPFTLPADRFDLEASTLLATDCDCSYFGGILAGPSDLDGDGIDDLLLGDIEYPGTFPAEGRVLVFLGGTVPAGSRVVTGDADFIAHGPVGEGFGGTVNSVVDIDGDGCDDWAASASGVPDEADQPAGLVYLVSGTVVSAASEAEITDASMGRVLGPRGGTLGASIETGDLDGDGAADLALRSTNGPGTGRVSVVRNYEIPTSGTLDLELAGLSFGARTGDDVRMAGPISMAGDVDGDGRDDLLIGDPGWDQYASSDSDGQAWLVLGF